MPRSPHSKQRRELYLVAGHGRQAAIAARNHGAAAAGFRRLFHLAADFDRLTFALLPTPTARTHRTKRAAH